MNYRLIILVMLLTSVSSSWAGLVLSQGDSFQFEFQSLSIFTSDPFGDPPALVAHAHFSLGSDFLHTGDSLTFSVFENSGSESELKSGLFEGTASGFTGGGLSLGDLPSVPWQDFQGVVEIEVTQGSVELNSFTVETIVDSQNYKQTFAIPEPSSAALVFAGAAIIYIRKNFQADGADP